MIRLILFVLLTAAMAAAASINPLIDDWRQLGQPNQDGVPYWDLSSFDTPKRNIGECLISGCGILPPMPQNTLQWYGRENGTATVNMGFGYLKPATAVVEVTLVASYTAYVDTIYWYGDDPTQLNQMFRSNDPLGTTVLAVTPNPFHLAFLSGDGTMYYSQSMRNSLPGSQQFAALRQQPGVVYIGIEDLPPGMGDDWQDAVLQIRLQGIPPQVPEPATFVLVAAGLLAGTLAMRRPKR